jgi:hypothetical protein
VLLRVSKQYCDLAGAAKSADTAQPLAETALDFGRRAVALDEKNAKAHLNLAVCYAKLTDFVGAKTKLEYSKLIRDEAQQSLALDATDDYAWHVMGRWNAGVTNVGVVMKTLARIVYDGLPSASNEDACVVSRKPSNSLRSASSITRNLQRFTSPWASPSSPRRNGRMCWD